jgi:hypothetical protein
MSKPKKRLLFGGLGLFAFLAILNPGYSSVYVNGPNGVIKTEKFKFGPGGLYVHTRVVADETSVTVEQP